MLAAATPVDAPVVEAPERLFGADDARAYRRFLEWSVGQGFAMAIVEVTAPRDRDALVTWTKAAVPRACAVALDQPERRPVRAVLEAACPSPSEASVLLLTGLEQAPDRERLRAELNVHRTSLVEAFPLPWVLFLHPAAARELELRAPDFADFANVWVREERADAVLDVPREQLFAGPMVGELAAMQGGGEPVGSDLEAQAEYAITVSRYDEATDLLASYDLRHPEARSENPWRIRQEGRLLWLRGESDEALGRFHAAMLLCDPVADIRLRAGLLGDVARVRQGKGDLSGALRLHEEQILAYQALGDRVSRAAVLMELADIRSIRGDVDEAFALYQEASMFLDDPHSQHAHAVALAGMGRLLVDAGDVDKALASYQEALAIFDEQGDGHSHAVTLCGLGHALARKGDLDRALSLYEEALTAHEAAGDSRSRAYALYDIARVLEDKGDVKGALARHREGLEFFALVGDVLGSAATRWSIGRIALEQGDFREAREQMSIAYSIFIEVGALEGLSTVGLDLGRLLVATGDEAQAEPILEHSRDGFQRLGWRDRAQEAQRLLDTLGRAG